LQWNLTLREWKCNYSWKKKKWKYIASWKRVTIFTSFDWIFTSKEWKYILKRVKIITLFQEVKKWRLYFHFLEVRFHCKKFRVYNYFVHYYFDGPKLFLNLYPFLNILTKLFFFPYALIDTIFIVFFINEATILADVFSLRSFSYSSKHSTGARFIVIAIVQLEDD